MPLTAADLKFFAATTNTDTPDGGGPRSATVVQNGVLNNLFPAVSSAARLSGQVSLRKLYPSLTNTDTAPLLGGTLALNEGPADPLVSVLAWRTGDATTTRAQAIAAFNTLHAGSTAGSWGPPLPWSTAETDTLTVNRPFTNTAPPAVGQRLAVFKTGEVGLWPRAHRCVVTSVSGPQNPGGTGAPTFWQVGIDPPLPSWVWVSAAPVSSDVTTSPAYGTTTLTASASSGQPVVAVASLSAQLVPYTGSGAYPTADLGWPPAGLAYANGRVPILRVGDTVTVSDEQVTSSGTAVVATPISSGRTNLDQIAIVGNDGVEIVRLLNGGPTSALASADFAAGTVTPTTVTGWSQPVTVRHRVAQRTTIASISTLNVTLADNLAAAMPSGAQITSEMPLGDIQARVSTVFAQQAWTRQWADTIIGNPAAAMYVGDITVTNQGAETDRYAVVFNDALTFTAYSERLGLLGSGTTGANFSPLNAATGVALFTLLSANWVGTPLVGSTLRFNTEGAGPPAWLARTVVPGAATSTTRAVVRLHGST